MDKARKQELRALAFMTSVGAVKIPSIKIRDDLHIYLAPPTISRGQEGKVKITLSKVWVDWEQGRPAFVGVNTTDDLRKALDDFEQTIAECRKAVDAIDVANTCFAPLLSLSDEELQELLTDEEQE